MRGGGYNLILFSGVLNNVTEVDLSIISQIYTRDSCLITYGWNDKMPVMFISFIFEYYIWITKHFSLANYFKFWEKKELEKQFSMVRFQVLSLTSSLFPGSRILIAGWLSEALLSSTVWVLHPLRFASSLSTSVAALNFSSAEHFDPFHY